MVDTDRNTDYTIPWLALLFCIIIFSIMTLGILLMVNYRWSLIP